MKRHIPMVVLFLAPLAVLATAGAVPLDMLTAASVHHVFHVVLPVVAFAVFAAYVAVDISKRGWPRFSWRLDA
jgi:hypothetical protein